MSMVSVFVDVVFVRERLRMVVGTGERRGDERRAGKDTCTEWDWQPGALIGCLERDKRHLRTEGDFKRHESRL